MPTTEKKKAAPGPRDTHDRTRREIKKTQAADAEAKAVEEAKAAAEAKAKADKEAA